MEEFLRTAGDKAGAALAWNSSLSLEAASGKVARVKGVPGWDGPKCLP